VKQRSTSWLKEHLTGAVALGALAVAVVPTAGLALTGGEAGFRSLAANADFSELTPASVDPRMARFVALRSSADARLARFTPAGVAERPNRTVTVAVRVGDEVVNAMSVRSAISVAKERGAGTRSLGISPTRFNLGLSRGYQSFVNAPQLSRLLSDASIPDLAAFVPTPGAKERPSRFAAHVALEEGTRAGVAPRSLAAEADQSVDVAGSYRLTRNLDVKAGLRYSQDRDRIAPLAEPAKQDSQAVYVGTQFRF
jgi:hypothetical protein